MNLIKIRNLAQNATNKQNDIQFMKRALVLAKRGWGHVSPNPMVGAVIVKQNRVLGEGYHRRFGGDHAEVDAIKNARENIAGATMYVTLEPCCFFGKTPPCVNRIIDEKIEKVVIGTVDPDPRVNQKGIEILLQRGIEVQLGPLEPECTELITAYSWHRRHKKPFTTIKIAQTLDGQIASVSGHSQWISSESSRKFAHQLRKANDAVMVGFGTALHDNPSLNVRHIRGQNPRRFILDAKLHLPLHYNVFQATDIHKTVIVTSVFADPKKLEQLHQIGVEVIQTETDERGRFALPHLWKQIGQMGVTSLLVEGGSGLITAILKQGLANRFVTAIAPLILGQGTPAVGDLGKKTISEAIHLTHLKRKNRDPDTILVGDIIG